jgi:glycosyltransferase involved in cell wall biosynthesis
MLDGVRVERAWLIPRGKGGALGLSANYLSFLFSAWFRHFRLARRGFDMVFCYEVSPLTMAIPAVAVARRARIPLTLYLTDLWPENVEAVNGIRNPRILAAIGRMAAWIYRRCDRVLVPSRSFVPRVTGRGMPRTRVEYWPQYAEDYYTASKSVEESDIKTPDPILEMLARIERCAFPVVFAGNIGTAQGLEILIEAARLFPPSLDAVFFLVGDGRARETLETRVREAGSPIADRIVFCGRVPGEQVPAFLSRAAAALMTLAPDPVFSLYLPTKLQVYLASGVPILSAAAAQRRRSSERRRPESLYLREMPLPLSSCRAAGRDVTGTTRRDGAAGTRVFRTGLYQIRLDDQLEDLLEHPPQAINRQESPW